MGLWGRRSLHQWDVLERRTGGQTRRHCSKTRAGTQMPEIGRLTSAFSTRAGCVFGLRVRESEMSDETMSSSLMARPHSHTQAATHDRLWRTQPVSG